MALERNPKRRSMDKILDNNLDKHDRLDNTTLPKQCQQIVQLTAVIVGSLAIRTVYSAGYV